jgi:electron transport complex protein RnfG
MVITLVAVTAVAAVSLGYVYQWTKEPIEQARLAAQLRAIEAVLPGCDNNPVAEQFFIPSGNDSLACFPGSKAGRPVGVAIKSKSAKGYSGDIWLMVGFDTAGIIKNIVVLQHQETPGLGSKMTGGKFLSQYLNVNPATTDLRMKKDGGSLDAISGATISARAFSEAVQTAFNSYRHHGKEN